MPAFPVDSDRAWAYWKAGLISATNVSTDVALPSFEDRALTDQRPILRNLAIRGGLNGIRISFDLFPITPGDDGQHELDVIAERGWGDTELDRKTLAHSWVEPSMRSIDNLAAHIDRILEQCAELGLGVIICVGQYYCGKGGALWRDLARHHSLVRFWAQTARRWPKHRALIGLEILNEPEPGFVTQDGREQGLFYSEMRRAPDNGRPESDANYNPQHYGRLMSRCIAAIRQANTTTPIVVGGIHGGHPDGLDIFRVKTEPDLDRDKYNTAWPSQWSPRDPPLDHGRNPFFGQDHSAGFSSSDRGNLLHDPAGMVVYTFHMYVPSPYCSQGIDAWSYHSIGLLYPKGDRPGDILAADQMEWRDGLWQVKRAEFHKGLVQLQATCERAISFRRDFDVPVFVGEFSAASLEYIRMLPQGTATTVSDAAEVRQIVGLSWRDGVATALLKRPVQVLMETRLNEAGLPYGELPAVLDVTIPGQRSSPYNVQQASGTLTGARYQPGAPTRFHRSPNHTITFALPGKGIAPLGLPTDSPGAMAAQAPSIGHFKIVITPELAQRQQSSRIQYIRDVLRLCQRANFSWGYFSDCLTPPRPDFVHEYFRVDPQGRIRALLRRAAYRSYE